MNINMNTNMNKNMNKKQPNFNYIWSTTYDLLKVDPNCKKFLNGLSGVYCWFNTVTGNYYVGSGVNLWDRVIDYTK